MSLEELAPLREVSARYGLSARKSLGQNFLLDLNLTGRIARTAGPLDGVTVIEIGAGPGGLTRALLTNGAAKVIAIERDERCIAALGEIAEQSPERLEIVVGDALKTDFSTLAPAPSRIVGNLPYNIATALLTGFVSVEPWPPFFDRLLLMFQLEVAERITAVPGSKAYGRLAVLAQWRTRPRLVFTVSPKAFVPAPKVTSALVEFTPREAPFACRRETLEKLTAAGFGQRRKMLRSSLKGLGNTAATQKALAALDALAIAHTARAESLTVEQFCAIARAIDA